MRQVHVNNKVGFSALTVLKPLTPGEVARLCRDGEGKIYSFRTANGRLSANYKITTSLKPPLLCKGGGFERLREVGGIKNNFELCIGIT